MKTLFRFKTVSVTKAGDYYQIMFHDDLDTDDEPYFMIQSQFEFPDAGCHFESHNEELIEDCKAESATLSANKLSVLYGKDPCREVEIKFRLHRTDFQELVSTLKEMMPEIEVEVESKC